jgi:hypothetical protein
MPGLPESALTMANFHTARIEQYIREGRTVSGGCGASSSQKEIAGQQQQNFQQLAANAQQVFGSSSQIFNDLTSSFAPIVAAGPGQSGFTAPELANLQSQAVTQGGIATRNAQQAAGERASAAGGGTSVLPNGATLGMNANIAEAGAANTANSLANINLQNAEVGRQNWMNAAGVLAGAPNVFNASTSAAGAGTQAGSAAMSGASTVQQANRQWVGDVMGVLGDATQIGSSFLTAGMGGDGVSSFDGGSVGGVSDPGLATPGYMPGGGPTMAAPIVPGANAF